MNAQRIPATVQLLTRNSAESLPRCLDSLSRFAEVLVQDGGSTDGTRELAARYDNVRLIDQPASALRDGRIIDFSAVRNDSIKKAAHDWIFVVDGDEYVDPDLVDEVAGIISRNTPGVYVASRRFYVDGTPIRFSAFYPSLQIRLFHRSLTDGYIKPVHERLALHKGVQTQMLKDELPVPFPPAASLHAKHERYLQIELHRQGNVPWGRWLYWMLWRNTKTVIAIFLKMLWIRIIPLPGKRFPLAYDWIHISYAIRLTVRTFPPFTRNRR